MPLEEQPGKVCEAFRLFLQGMGYGNFFNYKSLKQIHVIVIFYCIKQNKLAFRKEHLILALNESPALLLPGHNVYSVVSLSFYLHIFYNLES